MSLLKKILIIFFFLIPFSNSFAAMVTKIDDQVFQDAADDKHDTMGGPEFNKDGTKMFVSYHNIVNKVASGADDFIAEYTLSTPFDISTATYAGDSERCIFNFDNEDRNHQLYDLELTSDGMKILVVSRVANGGEDMDKVYVLNLTSPYDISSCTLASVSNDIDSELHFLPAIQFKLIFKVKYKIKHC